MDNTANYLNNTQNFKFCRKCGRKLLADAEFCDSCGTRQISTETQILLKPFQSPMCSIVTHSGNTAARIQRK
ncbi:MAG: zinc-ribbon domain-containing protein [[Eubacterium] siraeum]